MRRMPRTRLLLARRPWIYWTCVVGIAAALALSLRTSASQAEHQRLAWGTTQPVLIATRRLAPGETLVGAVSTRHIPAAIAPPSALSEVSSTATARQAIAVGEVIVGIDVAADSGPLSLLPHDWLAIVIETSDNNLFSVGDTAAVLAQGQILGPNAIVIRIIDSAIVVGVPADIAAAVADAANQHLATVALSANPPQQ